MSDVYRLSFDDVPLASIVQCAVLYFLTRKCRSIIVQQIPTDKRLRLDLSPALTGTYERN